MAWNHRHEDDMDTHVVLGITGMGYTSLCTSEKGNAHDGGSCADAPALTHNLVMGSPIKTLPGFTLLSQPVDLHPFLQETPWIEV